MAPPALYWQRRSISNLNMSDCLNLAKNILEDAGLTSIKIGGREVSGTKSDVHAFIGVVLKSSAPPMPVHALVFVAAGSNGAKDVVKSLVDAWDNLTFL
jgi:hypothetical protein